ncbi:hypothetical protein WJX82_000448 [Trebouxia sp. C0006]
MQQADQTDRAARQLRAKNAVLRNFRQAENETPDSLKRAVLSLWSLGVYSPSTASKVICESTLLAVEKPFQQTTRQVFGEPAAASLAVNHVQRSVKPKWSCSQEIRLIHVTVSQFQWCWLPKPLIISETNITG